MAGIAQDIGATAVAVLDAHQPLILELRERRVDRAGTRPPNAARPLLDFLHELIAVARLLRQQEQGSRADVPPACARSVRERAGPSEEGAEREPSTPERPTVAMTHDCGLQRRAQD